MKHHNQVFMYLFMISMISVNVSARNLESWIELSLKNNPEIQEAQSQTEQAKASLGEIRSYSLPTLSVGANAARTNNPLQVFGMKLMQQNASFNDFGINEFNPANPNVGEVQPQNLNEPEATNNFGLFIESEIPLFTGGKLYYSRDMVRSGIQASERMLEFTQEQTVFRVLQLRAQLIGSQAYLDVAQSGVKTYEKLVEKVAQMEREGLAKKSDLLTAQVKLNEAKLKQQEAQDMNLGSLDQLKLLAGLPIQADESLEYEEMDWKRLQPSLEVCLININDNAGLKAMKYQAKMAQSKISMENSGWYPTVGAQLKLEANDPDAPSFDAHNYTVGVEARWNVFAGGNTLYKTRQAKADYRRWQSQYKEMESQMQGRCSQIVRDLKRIELKLKARIQAVELAQEAFRIIDHQYKEGLTALVEWLATEVQLNKAQADLIATQVEYELQNSAYHLTLGSLNEVVVSQ